MFIAGNVSKETKLYTALDFEHNKNNVDKYFGILPNYKDNSIKICSEFFGLPNYSEIQNLIN